MEQPCSSGGVVPSVILKCPRCWGTPQTGLVLYQTVPSMRRGLGPSQPQPCPSDWKRVSHIINAELNGNKWMERWMDEWMDRWMNGWIDRQMNEWIGGWVDGWMNGWMNGQMAEWINGWMNEEMPGWKVTPHPAGCGHAGVWGIHKCVAWSLTVQGWGIYILSLPWVGYLLYYYFHNAVNCKHPPSKETDSRKSNSPSLPDEEKTDKVVPSTSGWLQDPRVCIPPKLTTPSFYFSSHIFIFHWF